MQEQLIRWFVKDYDSVKAPTVRTRYGNLTSLVGIITNLIICIGEIVVGLLVGSIAMISDGIHNVADAGGSAISFLASVFLLSKQIGSIPMAMVESNICYLLVFPYSYLFWQRNYFWKPSIES